MTDEEIADALVEAGTIVGSAMGTAHLPDGRALGGSASMVVNDWRTAGACLEHPKFFYALEQDEDGKFLNGKHYDRRATDGSMPRAICEAFVRALSTGDSGT